MTLSRRDFLRRTTLAVAGGLIVGDEALALLERLTHRKVWALGPMPYTVDITTGAFGGMFSAILEPVPRGAVIRRVIIDGQDADKIQPLGLGPNGGEMVRAWRDLGGSPMYTVNAALIRGQLPPAVRGIHAQLEDSRWPTSPIVTYDRPVERPADHLFFDWPVNRTQGWIDGRIVGLDVARSTPPRVPEFPSRPGILVESKAINYALHSGDPRRPTS